MFAVRFCMHTSFAVLNEILLRSFAIVNDLYTFVYDTEKNDRNTEPCNTAKYGRIRSVWWTFTSVYCRVRISESSTWATKRPMSNDLHNAVLMVRFRILLSFAHQNFDSQSNSHRGCPFSMSFFDKFKEYPQVEFSDHRIFADSIGSRQDSCQKQSCLN